MTTENNTLLDNIESGFTDDASLVQTLSDLMRGEEFFPRELPESAARIQVLDNTALTNEQYATVHPNPANSETEIIVKNVNEFPQELEYQITDMKGIEMTFGKFTDKKSINMNNWAQGIYFLRIRGQMGIQLIKLIKL